MLKLIKTSLNMISQNSKIAKCDAYKIKAATLQKYLYLEYFYPYWFHNFTA